MYIYLCIHESPFNIEEIHRCTSLSSRSSVEFRICQLLSITAQRAFRLNDNTIHIFIYPDDSGLLLLLRLDDPELGALRVLIGKETGGRVDPSFGKSFVVLVLSFWYRTL